MSFSSSFRDWLAAPAERPGGQRYCLDSHKCYSSEKAVSIQCKGKDLESQSSVSSIKRPRRQSTASGTETSNSAEGLSQRSWHRSLFKTETWKPSKDIMYNAIIGTSDGMTVPFAVTASLAGVTDAKLVMMAGLAELIGGAISMSAGGVLGARTDTQKYALSASSLSTSLQTDPSTTSSMISETFTPHLGPDITSRISAHVSSLPESSQADFLLRFTNVYHECEPPTTAGIWKIALVLGIGYFSGLIPLIPYMIVPDVNRALYISIGVTGFLLAVFGYGKNALTLNGHGAGVISKGRKVWMCVQGSLECLCVVGVSAGLSVLIIRGVGGTL